MNGDISRCSASSDSYKIVVLRELCVIANSVSLEEFLKIMTEMRTHKKVKWTTMYNCLRDQISKTLTQDWEHLWAEENLTEKLEFLLNKTKTTSSYSSDRTWRPTLGDAAPQLRSHYMRLLENQKKHQEEITKAAEANVDKLKSELLARRNYLKTMKADIALIQKQNVEHRKVIKSRINSHEQYIKSINIDLD